MKIVMQQDVAKVGKEGELVTVADGFARNYLIPRSLALPATASVVKVFAARKAAEEKRAETLKADAEKNAETLEGKSVKIEARTGSSDRLFGSITAADVAEAVAKSLGVTVDKRKVQLVDAIKAIGTYTVPVKLHRDITVPITVEVVKASA